MVSPAKILIVDDEPSVRFFLQEALARDGHDVVTVESGEAALEYSESQEFELALLDLKLKGMDGIEVLREMSRRSPDTAVIVLTGHASLETAVEALRQGAYDYLFKPCKTDQLRESVRLALIEHRRDVQQREVLTKLKRTLIDLEDVPPSVPESLSPSDGADDSEDRFLRQKGLTVDKVRHLITLDGHLLELSSTEFDILVYLIRKYPNVVSPEDLVREVQGYDSDPWEASNIIRSHIYRIRRKIESATGESDVIRTVRGVGYTLEE